MSTPKLAALEALARDLVGDGKRDNLYFVTDNGIVVTITRDRTIARAHFDKLAARRPFVECALEDRLYGTIASVEPVSDTPGARLELVEG